MITRTEVTSSKCLHVNMQLNTCSWNNVHKVGIIDGGGLLEEEDVLNKFNLFNTY